MKKLITVLATICLVFAVAGNASADFNYYMDGTDRASLGLSVYNPETGIEIGYDLGTLNGGLDLAAQNLLLDTIDVSDTGATVSLYSATAAYQSFFGLTTDTATGISSNCIINFQNSVRDVFNFGYSNGESPVQISTGDPKSASSIFKDYGNYQGIVSGGNDSLQPSLDPLATADSFDIYLYQYDGENLNTGFDPATDYAAIITIFDNGNVVLNTPVPAGIWLLGSGLLGLIGIRRKNA